MSDTPETDDQPTINAINDNGYQVPCVDIEFARKLERERDEARDAIRALAEHGESEIQRITKERDEARNKMADALQEVDLRTLDFERMKKERDEAREAMREMWQSGDAFLPYIDNETTSRWRKTAGWEETK